MKVSAIRNYYDSSANYARKQQQNVLNNEPAFKGGKRGLCSAAGGALGAAAGGAIIGGGSLAGAAALAATGPVGWALVGLYTIGGLVSGSWLGDGIDEAIEDKSSKSK